MSVQPSAILIDYPESDGRPMGETDLHRYWMSRVIDLLSYYYRDQMVYVSGNLLVYYERGSTHKFVVPDALVAKEREPSFRRVYKIWEEGKCPDVVFEVTSSSTQREDTVFKLPLYERIGIQELFLYDPTGDYLRPSLAGYRSRDGNFRQIAPDANGALVSEQIGIMLRIADDQLVMHDVATGQVLRTRAEAAEARAEAEAKARREIEAELARLREQFERNRDLE